jgi:hypothetical protein
MEQPQQQQPLSSSDTWEEALEAVLLEHYQEWVKKLDLIYEEYLRDPTQAKSLEECIANWNKLPGVGVFDAPPVNDGDSCDDCGCNAK